MTGSTSGTSADPDINFPVVSGVSTRVINNTEYDLGMSFTNGYAKPELNRTVKSYMNKSAISHAATKLKISNVIEF